MVRTDKHFPTLKSAFNNVNLLPVFALPSSHCTYANKPFSGVELRIGQRVWVKEPLGKLNDLHVCGMVGK